MIFRWGRAKKALLTACVVVVDSGLGTSSHASAPSAIFESQTAVAAEYKEFTLHNGSQPRRVVHIKLHTDTMDDTWKGDECTLLLRAPDEGLCRQVQLSHCHHGIHPVQALCMYTPA